MKFTAVPGSAPGFGWQTVDLARLALAVLGIFAGLRACLPKKTAVFTAVVVGAVVVLMQ